MYLLLDNDWSLTRRYISNLFVLSGEAVEFTDCISAEE